ncbi:MAG: polysaccharide biosynthesis/export family protein [Hyphomicrobiaceae bacterium]
MSKRLVGFCGAALMLLSGCAIDHESGVADASIAGPRDAAAVNGYPTPVAAGPDDVVAMQQSWGEPHVLRNLKGPRAVADTDGPYLLDSGDRLRIFVYGQPNLSRSYTVDHSGQITVPLIGEVNARGLTTVALERTIKSRLGTQYVKDPQVTVDMLQNRPFFILGEVKTAGQYPYVSGMTVETAVAIAGGYSDRASLQKFRISRRINGLVEVIEAPSDYVVQPGDTVTVFERFL